MLSNIIAFMTLSCAFSLLLCRISFTPKPHITALKKKKNNSKICLKVYIYNIYFHQHKIGQ